MYKNQLQELAQRSCFNLPSYTCIREGPDHAPRFKATVNFNGETFESPHYCSTLRQAEHSAAEVALNSLSNRGPSHSLAARILDETGVYKNLLQEIAQRVSAPLPQYTTYRSGLGHLPVFTGTVELAGITFTGEPAKNKKQAEKNAAMAAWSSLKQLAKDTASSSSEPENSDELEQITIARALSNYRLKEKMANPNAPVPFTKKFPVQHPRPTSPQPPPATTSKILPLICQRTASRHRPHPSAVNDNPLIQLQAQPLPPEGRGARPQKFPAVEAAPYVPIRQLRTPCHGIAPPVTIRTAVPVFSAPPLPPHGAVSRQVIRAPPVRIAPPVTIRQAVPVFSAPSTRKDDLPVRKDDPQPILKEDPPAIRKEDPPAAFMALTLQNQLPAQIEETGGKSANNDLIESRTAESVEQLKI
ncbi:Double-stranded RNA-binding domain containing protein [Parasponia andersonii]|uniref:Double-stranded RNA-binding domain containing protein n=1 Tax=Parasponia andersonii TaxID=3476 RepID=A0A2P5DU62_PARAD|nr:Double-stranded RNA-binding domain containing protein [Parasponia andersonii]